jgi:hypothetical protein
MAASSPIPSFIRNDPPDAATRIGHVAVTPGNYVNMSVEDCLASGFPVVQPDVEGVGVQIVIEPIASLSH